MLLQDIWPQVIPLQIIICFIKGNNIFLIGQWLSPFHKVSFLLAFAVFLPPLMMRNEAEPINVPPVYWIQQPRRGFSSTFLPLKRPGKTTFKFYGLLPFHLFSIKPLHGFMFSARAGQVSWHGAGQHLGQRFPLSGKTASCTWLNLTRLVLLCFPFA